MPPVIVKNWWGAPSTGADTRRRKQCQRYSRWPPCRGRQQMRGLPCNWPPPHLGRNCPPRRNRRCHAWPAPRRQRLRPQWCAANQRSGSLPPPDGMAPTAEPGTRAAHAPSPPGTPRLATGVNLGYQQHLGGPDGYLRASAMGYRRRRRQQGSRPLRRWRRPARQRGQPRRQPGVLRQERQRPNRQARLRFRRIRRRRTRS